MDKTEAKQLQEDLGVRKEIKLLIPIKLGSGHLLEKVTLRRLKVGDMRAVAHIGNDAERELTLFSRATGLIPEDFDLLDVADYTAIQEWFRLTTEQKATAEQSAD